MKEPTVASREAPLGHSIKSCLSRTPLPLPQQTRGLPGASTTGYNTWAVRGRHRVTLGAASKLHCGTMGRAHLMPGFGEEEINGAVPGEPVKKDENSREGTGATR
ncbi:hypothetical protein INR49_000409 [Caranx melampygus]|nr:hypothetical protein INR49_000409 [Caranx melampygus]